MKFDGSKCPICHGKKSLPIKSIGIGITLVTIVGIVGFLVMNGTIDINENSFNEKINNIPENVQDTVEIAKDVTTDTSKILSKTVNEQLENIPLDSVGNSLNDITNNAKEVIMPKIDENDLEKQIHHLINQYRLQNGLDPLSLDDKLSNIARTHSQDMASRDYFEHETPEGKTPTSRATSEGYQCQKDIGNLIYSGIAENIYQNNLYNSVTIIGIVPIYDWNSQDQLAHSTVDGWMNSYGHRQNILSDIYDVEGIGVAIASDSKVYITQDFC
jgi:uncharacterized protein YkwD